MPPPSAVAPLRKVNDFAFHDTEALRLILRGGSVVDWHRLNFEHEAQAVNLVKNHELRLDLPSDVLFIKRAIADSIGYLRRQYSLAIPKVVEEASLVELMMMASGKGHRQNVACTILKTLTITHYLSCRELLFRLPVSDRDLFHLVEEKVYRVVGAMLSGGFPITEFIGGRKNLDSTYTKLLSKSTSTASNLYDKLRFRIVAKTQADILPILLYLSEHLFPFNAVIAGESTNTLFHFPTYCESVPHLAKFVQHFQGVKDEALSTVDNRFSAKSYRVIHYVANVPVRVPEHLMELAPPGSENLGPVVQVPCEFQMLDGETDSANEVGEASHDAYKQRQREAVFRRLRLGAQPQGSDSESPPGSETGAPESTRPKSSRGSGSS
jgi:uncharacterized protein (TIGR04552 family)